MSPETILGDRIAAALAARVGTRPLVVGVCGAQGSGKTTLVARLAQRFPRSATLSLDDLYLSREARRALARDIHPLFATRGVPGTHDVALGQEVLARLGAGEPVRLPRFDKARDDRLPEEDWPQARADCELVLFEGWCVGARAQPAAALAVPVNALEAEEDADAKWRVHVNSALKGDYASLFGRLDRLALLAAPDWATVPRWRMQQEEDLRRRAGAGAGIMADAEIARFTAHFERLTRWILAEMPARALTLYLNAQRRPVATTDGGGEWPG